MHLRKFAGLSLATVAGAAMLMFSMAPASAFTLPSRSLEQPMANTQIEKAYYVVRHPVYHHPVHRHCVRGRYGHLVCHHY
jgi:hypothetical protein